jgi:hypothetical protein
MNHIILIGRLTRDPDLRYTPNGVAVANFDLAVDRPTKNQAGEKSSRECREVSPERAVGGGRRQIADPDIRGPGRAKTLGNGSGGGLCPVPGTGQGRRSGGGREPWRESRL